MVALPRQFSEKLLERARRHIERHSTLACDLAANCGQILGNVGHMSWFVQAVAAELAPPPRAATKKVGAC